MRERAGLLIALSVAALALAAQAQLIPWLSWTLLPKAQMDEIVGEASGETAWKTIASVAAFNRDRRPEEFSEMFLETRVVSGLLKDYGIAAEVRRYPAGQAWDPTKGELWEVAPRRQKLASFNDMVPMLAAWSSSTDTSADLVWVGRGTPGEIAAVNVEGRIVVTEGNITSVASEACLKKGALGVVAISMLRPYFDPLQLPWAQVKAPGIPGIPSSPTIEKAFFGFILPVREGDLLKKRLLAGETITVRAQVEARAVPYSAEDVIALIPGSDPAAGEVILSAHLFEGIVKQGANDNISGSACILEVARVLNVLVAEGRLPRPKRGIRFIWAPEYSGTGKWVRENPDLMARTLCNINMDMVGEWLSRNQSTFSLMRTTYGMPHYVNDVAESYYRFVGEANRDKLHDLRRRESAPQGRIVAPFGADEPFHYAVEWHFGSSDHEVFNDWSVGVPGVMMIAWPDRWYHTSGDLADKADPTQLKRAAVIGAAAAYTIASADEPMAVRIASETAANGARRIPVQLQSGLAALDKAGPEGLAEAYQKGYFGIEAALANEKATLGTVLELAPGAPGLARHVSRLSAAVDAAGASARCAIKAHMEAVAERLGARPVRRATLSPLEAKAAKLRPRRADKVRAGGYMDYEAFRNALPEALRPESPLDIYLLQKGVSDVAELRRLIDGTRSALDIKRTLDAESDQPSDLQAILDHLDLLKRAGLVEMD